ncbi:MAG: hypothetical protein Q3962_04005 [Corynebacterium sp.]|nr:hypothetical protein [Corynebacterium sp.]
MTIARWTCAVLAAAATITPMVAVPLTAHADSAAVVIVSGSASLAKAVQGVSASDSGLSVEPVVVNDNLRGNIPVLAFKFSVTQNLVFSANELANIRSIGIKNWYGYNADHNRAEAIQNGIKSISVIPNATLNVGSGVTLYAGNQDYGFGSGTDELNTTSYANDSRKYIRWTNDNVSKNWDDAQFIYVGDGHYTIRVDGATQLTPRANIWVSATSTNIDAGKARPSDAAMAEYSGGIYKQAGNVFLQVIDNLTAGNSSKWAKQLKAYARTVVQNASDTEDMSNYAVDVVNLLNGDNAKTLQDPEAVALALGLRSNPKTVAGVVEASRTSADFLDDTKVQYDSALAASSADETASYAASAQVSAQTALDRADNATDFGYATQAWALTVGAYVSAAKKYVIAGDETKAEAQLSATQTAATQAKNAASNVTAAKGATQRQIDVTTATLEAALTESAATVDGIKASLVQDSGQNTEANTSTAKETEEQKQVAVEDNAGKGAAEESTGNDSKSPTDEPSQPTEPETNPLATKVEALLAAVNTAAANAASASDAQSAAAAATQAQQSVAELIATVNADSTAQAAGTYKDAITEATATAKKAFASAIDRRADLTAAEKTTAKKTVESTDLEALNVELIGAKTRAATVISALPHIDSQKQSLLDSLDTAATSAAVVEALADAISTSVTNNDQISTEEKTKYIEALKSASAEGNIDSVLNSSPYSSDGILRDTVGTRPQGPSSVPADPQQSMAGIFSIILGVFGIGTVLTSILYALNPGIREAINSFLHI